MFVQINTIDGYYAQGSDSLKGNPNIDQRIFQHVERMDR